MKIQNKKINEDDFLRQRKKVLAMWPTGRDVDLDEAIASFLVEESDLACEHTEYTFTEVGLDRPGGTMRGLRGSALKLTIKGLRGRSRAGRIGAWPDRNASSMKGPCTT